MYKVTEIVIPIITRILSRYMNNPNQWVGRECKLEDIIGNKKDMVHIIKSINDEVGKTVFDLKFTYHDGITYGDLIDKVHNFSNIKNLQHGKN